MNDLSLDIQGAEVGQSFVRRVLWRQALIGVVAFMVVALMAPWSLMLESRGLSQVWLVCVEMGAGAIVMSTLLELGTVGTLTSGLPHSPALIAGMRRSPR